MIEAATTPGEVAGVMAHELSHVVLRHGTAQATKAQKFQLGALAGQILGAIVGGTAGGVIAEGSQFGLGAYFLKYGREYERQADLLGAQIMARAGYDPRQMAAMFRTIERAGGGRGGPEWLSSHPNPGNRYEAIDREAAMLRVQGSPPSDREFRSVQARLRSMRPAPTMEQVARGREPGSVGTSGRTVRVEPPSTRWRTYEAGDFLRLSVPANWAQMGGGETITYAPEGGVVRAPNGQTAITHGLQVGVVENGSGSLQRDTEQLIETFARSNPELRQEGGYRRDAIGGRRGLTTVLSNVSDATGELESVTLSTMSLDNGSVLFLLGIVPDREAEQYRRAFTRIRQSVEIEEALVR
jgi:hypothetical protein